MGQRGPVLLGGKRLAEWSGQRGWSGKHVRVLCPSVVGLGIHCVLSLTRSLSRRLDSHMYVKGVQPHFPVAKDSSHLWGLSGVLPPWAQQSEGHQGQNQRCVREQPGSAPSRVQDEQRQSGRRWERMLRDSRKGEVAGMLAPAVHQREELARQVGWGILLATHL